MKKIPRQALYAAVALVAVALIAVAVLQSGGGPKKMPLSTYLARVTAGEVRTATIKDKDHVVSGKLRDGSSYKVTFPDLYTTDLTLALQKAHVAVTTSQQGQPWWESLLESVLPLVVLIGAFFYFISTMQGGGGKVMQFGKAKARRANQDQPSVTFSDVAGADEAVEELQEIKDFLQNPAKFQAIGAKIPQGRTAVRSPGNRQDPAGPSRGRRSRRAVLLHLGFRLRRDVRRCGGLPGARPVRAGQEPRHPAIIFMDEIDAVGRHRGAGMGGGHDEREQTLNQLLVEMDGFDPDAPASSSSPPPTGPTSSTRRCCGPAASTARSWWTSPTSSGAGPSSRCTARASRWRPTCRSTWWPAAPRASPAPTWPTC